jgi:hypothetical protein
MTAFAAAATAIFGDRNLAEDAEWWPAQASVPIPIRAVFAAPTALDQAFGQTIARDGLVAWVPASSAIAQGDRIRRAGAFHPVRNVPELDVETTQIRLDLGPAGAR